MTSRYEDLSDTELRTLTDDLGDRIDALDSDSDGAPDDLLDEWAQATREESRRDALAARKVGRYSVALSVNGEPEEHALKATTLEDAEAEAQSGVEAMIKMSGQTVTIERINAPISE